MTDRHNAEIAPACAPSLATIPNSYPLLTTRIRLTYPFEQLCPMSGEPQPGSTITIHYDASAVLLEIKSLRHYLASFVGDNLHGVRDLEEAAQVIAQHCADMLKTPVHVVAQYYLHVGEMEVEVRAGPRP